MNGTIKRRQIIDFGVVSFPQTNISVWATQTVQLNKTMPDTNYYPFVSGRTGGAGWAGIRYAVFNKTTSSFDIRYVPVQANAEAWTCFWMVIR